MEDTRIMLDTCELAYEMFVKSRNDKGKDVKLIANYEVVSEVIKDLLTIGDTQIISVIISDPDICGYNNEYIVTVDDEQNIWCQPFKSEKGYLIDDCESSDVYFVHEDVSMVAIRNIDEEKIKPFHFEWED